MKLTTLIHNGTIKKDQDIFLGTGCSFFFIGTASELRGYARQKKVSLLPRKVLDHYPRLQKDGYVVIIEGDETGGYWFKSEYAEGKKQRAYRIGSYANGKARTWEETRTGNRAKVRSKTFPCIAKAMAEQWG